MNIEHFWNSWVLSFHATKPGKTITIMALTHGNEPAWLETLNYLIEEMKIAEKLESWTLHFVLWNLKAFELNQRLTEVDMNRVWSFDEKHKNSYEYQRASELKDILSKTDYFLDIHSTSKPAQPFILPHTHVHTDLLKRLKADYAICDIARFIHGKSTMWFVADQNSTAVTLTIECGSHSEQKTTDLSIYNTLVFLDYTWQFDHLWVFDDFIEKKIYCAKEVIHASSIDVTFLYNSNPKSFDAVSKWQEIVRHWSKIFSSSYNGYILMPSQAKYIWEEIGYTIIDKF